MSRILFASGLLIFLCSNCYGQHPVDSNGFLNWLNTTRSSYRLPPVNYDNNLAAWAAQNNYQQLARGMGHYIIAPARRQNSAVGSYDIYYISNLWMASPGHRSALLDPTIQWIGIAVYNGYWTFNAR